MRPSENHDPSVDEIEAWWPVLEAELVRVDPSVVVPMGSFATAEILETDEMITDLHGTTVKRNGRLIRPSFHPTAALDDRSKVEAIESALGAALEDA